MIQTLPHNKSSFILANNYIGYLSYIFKNRPFIVPITYYFNEENNTVIGYSAKGQKTSAMRKNTIVSLAVAEIESVNHWKSVLAHGTYKEIEGSEAKAYLHQFSLGVKDIITKKEHERPDFISDFSSKISKEDVSVVFIITIDSITGRMRYRD